jgi:putative endonuclease
VREHRYFVYILSSRNRVLYVGMTSNLFKRINQHRTKRFAGFTAEYDVDQLMYFEEYRDVNLAIGREREIKKWRRAKKLALIRSVNPEWRDLAAELFF